LELEATATEGRITSPEPGPEAELSTSEPRHVTTIGSLERWELVAVAALVVCVSAWTLFQTTDMWFYSDIWASLTDTSLLRFDDLNRSHGGHWQVTNVATIRTLYSLVGMSFWPWYLLPRTLLYGAFAVAWWRIARWRGVAPLPALGFLALVLLLTTTAWLTTAAYTGALVVRLAALGAAVLVHSASTGRERPVLMFALLAVALMSGGSGVAVWGAVAIVLVVTRTWRPYLVPLVATAAMYLWWYSAFGRHTSPEFRAGIPSLTTLRHAPTELYTLLRATIEQVLSVGWLLGTALLVVALVAFVFVMRRGLLGRFEVVLLTIGGLLAVLTVVLRAQAGFSTTAPNKLDFVATYILLPLLVALIRAVSARMMIGAVTLLIVLAMINGRSLAQDLEERSQVQSQERERVEAAAHSLAVGDPALPWAYVSPQARNSVLAYLLDDGWQPPPPSDQSLVAAVGGEIRMAVLPSTPLPARPVLEVPRSEGDCMSVEGGDKFSADLLRGGATVLTAPPSSSFALRWRDGSDVYRRDGVIGPAGSSNIVFAAPSHPVTIELVGNWSAPATYCGFVSP
jgi:hypothetical protein